MPDRTDNINFVERFDSIAQLHAEKSAVEVDGTQSVTYRRLQQQSFSVARTIENAQVGERPVIGLHLEKSPELLAAIIGIWRAACAWVPISPSLPESQQRFLLQDIRPQLVLTDDPGNSLFEGLTTCEVPTDLSAESIQPAALAANDLAYIIYTSGTTGTPRGVEVTHAGIMNLIDAQIDAFRITASSRCLWFYPPSFDASVSDWGTALSSGATLLIEAELTETSGENMIRRLENRRTTHADIPPSLLSILPEPSPASTLQTVIVGGQATDAKTIRRWAKKVRLVNVYGPTEATVCTSLCVSDPSDTQPQLGQPIANVEYRIVDLDLNPSPVGTAGELLIAGPCLARGYINQPSRTREKFVMLNGRRFYRSGDKVHRDASGRYIFHGRIDRQLSLNGIRVEPEEIEAALMMTPGVNAAALVMRKLTSSSRRDQLVAFVEGDRLLDPTHIRTQLGRRLSPNKHPSLIKVLSELPRMSSGKADLKTLSTLELTDSDPTPVEGRLSALVDLLREVTGEPDLGPDDRFRDWGGDSLAAIHLTSLAAEQGLEFPPSLVAANPTARELDDFLDREVLRETAPDPIGYRCPVETLRIDARTVRQSLDPLVTRTQSQNGTAILLTGATGFLGCRVLAELLERTNRQIFCVVRGAEIEGRQRLLKHLNDQEISLSDEQFQRITTVAGDVALPGLGLSETVSGQFHASVRSVIHCAANVNALSDYAALRQANVVGVANALEFAVAAGASLHYASTLSVFVGTDNHQGVFSEASAIEAKVAFGGYSQTKLAAEFLLTEQTPPVPVHLHRFGLLSADSRSGLFPENDILTMTVRGLQQLGCVPQLDRDLRFDMTPVNYAGQAMAAIAVQEFDNQTTLAAWHIAGQTTVTSSQLFEQLGSYFHLRSIPVSEFLRRLRDVDLASVRMSFQRWLGDGDCDQYRSLDLFQSTKATFDCEHTRQFLATHGVECPPLTSSLMDVSLSRMCRETKEGTLN